jgi:prefoldin subunit 5
LKEVSGKLTTAKSSSYEIEKLQLQINQQESYIKDRTKGLEAILKEDNNELNKTLENFENVMKIKNSQVIELRNKIEGINNEIIELREISNGLNMKKGQSLSYQDAINDLQKNQISMILTLKQKYSSFPNPQTKWTIAMTKEIISLLSRELQVLMNEKENSLYQLKTIMEENEKLLNEITNNLSKIEIEIKLKNEEILNLTNEIELKRIEINKLSSSRTQVQRCEIEYDSALKNHNEFMESYNMKSNDYKKQIKELSDKIRDLQETITTDAQLLQDLSHHRTEVSPFHLFLGFSSYYLLCCSCFHSFGFWFLPLFVPILVSCFCI